MFTKQFSYLRFQGWKPNLGLLWVFLLPEPGLCHSEALSARCDSFSNADTLRRNYPRG